MAAQASAQPDVAMVSVPAPAAARHFDKMTMLAATIARMALGLLTFVLLARFLGPTQFGVIATAMAYATFVSLATDYGLNTFALRKASISPDRAGRLVGDALAVKALLSLAVLPVAVAVAAVVVPRASLVVYAAVFSGTLVYSFADLSMIVARAHRRFDVEAVVVIATSIVMLVVVGGVAASTGDVGSTAVAFLGSRLFYLATSSWRLRHWLGPIAGLRRTVAEMHATLRESGSYAVDNILTVLTGQIDVLLFALVLAPYQMGVYQAGARLVGVIVPFAVVLSTVYLPALAAMSVAADGGAGFRGLSRRVTIEFAGLAVLGGVVFALLGPLVTRWFYGPAYAALVPLWGGFAVSVMLRFAAAGFNIQLVALNRVAPRIMSNVAAIAVFAVVLFLIRNRLQLGSAPWLLSVMGAVNFAVVSWSLIRDPRRSPAVVVAAVAVPVIALLVAALTRVG